MISSATMRLRRTTTQRPLTRNTASNRQAGSVANQRSENISGRTDTRSNARDSRGENRDFASDNRQERVSDRGDSQAVRVSNSRRNTFQPGRRARRKPIPTATHNEANMPTTFGTDWKMNSTAIICSTISGRTIRKPIIASIKIQYFGLGQRLPTVGSFLWSRICQRWWRE